MKKILLLSLCITIVTLNASSQDTLKVNFLPLGAAEVNGWGSVFVTDKVLYAGAPVSFEAFGGTIDVTPNWYNQPLANNIRAINRTGDTYTGSLADVLRTYIAVDSRYENDCNILSIQITGLPQGIYTFKSYHHDFGDQYGSFTVETGLNGESVDEVTDGKMISHSRTLESVETEFGALDPLVATNYKNTYVSSSLDSVTNYTFDQIESSGTSNIINVYFQNILTPSPEMAHSLKFTLINGFILYKNNVNGVNDDKIKTYNISFANQSDGKVLLKGNSISKVDIYSVKGLHINSVYNEGAEIMISNLQKGVYIAKIRINNGELVNKKFVVY